MIRPSLVFAIVISATLQGLVLFWPVLFPQAQQPQADTPVDSSAEAPVVVAIADASVPEPEPEAPPEQTPQQPPEAAEPPAPEPAELEAQPEAPAPMPELPEAPAPSSPEPTPEPVSEPTPSTPVEPTPTPAPEPATEPEPAPTPQPTPTQLASNNDPTPGPQPDTTQAPPPVNTPTPPTRPTAPTPPVTEPTSPIRPQPTTNANTRQGPSTPTSDSDSETGVVFNFRAADMPRLRELRGVMILIIDDRSRVLDEVDLSTGTPRRTGRLPRDLLGPLARGLENHTTLEYASDQRNTRQQLGLAPNEKLFVALPNRLASEISHAYALKAEQMRRQGLTLGLAACQLEIRGSRVVPIITPLN